MSSVAKALNNAAPGTTDLFEWACRNAEQLRAGEGEQCAGSGISASLVAKGRNVVYRLSRMDAIWFLKISHDPADDIVTAEETGFSILKQIPVREFTLALVGPSVVRCSARHGFVLTSAVSGRHLMAELYKYSLIPSPLFRRFLVTAFREFGMQLAELHRLGMGCTTTPSSRPTLRRDYEDAVRKLAAPDDVSETPIRQYAGNLDFEADSFVHGNLRRENVFLGKRNLSLIDFEDSGIGSRYLDLSRIVANLIAPRTVRCFPWRFAHRVLTSFLHGYGSRQAYEHVELLRAVTIRMATTHAKLLGGHPATLCGVPLSVGLSARVIRRLPALLPRLDD